LDWSYAVSAPRTAMFLSVAAGAALAGIPRGVTVVFV
jgi:hypothetical protein